MMSAIRSLTFNQRSAAFREKVISSLRFSNRLAKKKDCEYVSESLVERAWIERPLQIYVNKIYALRDVADGVLVISR